MFVYLICIPLILYVIVLEICDSFGDYIFVLVMILRLK